MDQSHTALTLQEEKPASPPSYREHELESSSQKVLESAPWQHFLLVTNARSGSSRGDELPKIAEEKAEHFQKKISLLTLNDDIEAQILKAVENGVQVLIAAGGDGTVAAVATIAYRLGLPLGVIPSGTANLFARELNIPLQAEAAFDVLFNTREARSVDVIIIEDKIYLCHITVGTYTSISSQTQPEHKKKFGRAAYVWKALKLIYRKSLWTFHMEIDGRKLRRRASTLMITNVGVMGAGAMRWTPDAKIDDGIIEICVIRARSFRHYLELFWAYLMKREHPHLQETIAVHNYARITPSARLPVQGDGEDIARGQFEFKVHGRSLTVLAGDDTPQSVLH